MGLIALQVVMVLLANGCLLSISASFECASCVTAELPVTWFQIVFTVGSKLRALLIVH